MSNTKTKKENDSGQNYSVESVKDNSNTYDSLTEKSKSYEYDSGNHTQKYSKAEIRKTMTYVID